MSGEQPPGDSPNAERPRTGLDDPRALQILTTEHWSLLSTRALGYQEMFARTTIFVAVLTGTVVALALLADATHFGPQTLAFALVLMSVTFLIGVATFVRSVAINWEDARWVMGMNRLRHAYLLIVPEVEPFFVTGHDSEADRQSLALSLGHGSPQRLANLANSLTTTSSVVAALNSMLAGALASDLGAILGLALAPIVGLGTGVSLVSAALHVRFAGRFRRKRAP